MTLDYHRSFFFPATDDTFLINVTWNLSDIRSCSEKQVFTLQHFFNVSQNTLVSVVLYFYKLISPEINMSFNVNERRKKKGILSLDMKIVKIVYKYV